MTPKEFAEGFYKEKLYLHELYLNENSSHFVSNGIKSLNLDNEEKQIMAEIIDGILTDAFYTILLGIDGEASIGDKQISYKLFGEESNEITGRDLESKAWEFFHGNLES